MGNHPQHLVLLRTLPILALLLILAGCSRSSDYYLHKRDDFLAKDKLEAAAVNHEKAISKGPVNGQAYFRLRPCRAKLGRIDEAENAPSPVVELTPNLNDAKLALSSRLLRSYWPTRGGP